MAECRCNDEATLTGAAADDYVESHLVRESVEEGAREVVYRCPQTQRLWALEVDQMRLRRLMTPLEIVEFFAAEPPMEERLALTGPEVEFRPLGESTVYRGLDEARRWAKQIDEMPDAPRVAVLSVIEHGDDVVVLGTVSERREGTYVEQKPAAWLVSAKHGRVTRHLWFDSWEAAREAAGLPQAGGPEPRKLRTGFLWLLRRPLRPRLA